MDQQFHELKGAQLDASKAMIGRSTEDYQVLAKLRRRLQVGGDPEFVNSFFEMAGEMEVSLGRARGSSGAPLQYSYGGDPGASSG